jgi:hypothetical protein
MYVPCRVKGDSLHPLAVGIVNSILTFRDLPHYFCFLQTTD